MLFDSQTSLMVRSNCAARCLLTYYKSVDLALSMVVYKVVDRRTAAALG